MALYDSKDTVLYLAQFDVTDYTTSAGLSSGRNMHDATVFGKSGAVFHPGTETSTVSWSGLYDDTATTGSEALMSTLKGESSSSVVSFYPATDAVGKQMYSSDGGWIIDNATDASVGSMVLMSGTINLDVATRSKALGTKATVTASASGTAVDDSSSSSNGGSYVYHIFALSAVGGNARWNLNLEHSADNLSWDAVASATVTASDGIGAAKTAFTGTLNRYVRQRIVLDASSGSLTAAMNYSRT